MNERILNTLRIDSRSDKPISSMLLLWAGTWIAGTLLFAAVLGLVTRQVPSASDVLPGLVGLALLDLMFRLPIRRWIKRHDGESHDGTQVG